MTNQERVQDIYKMLGQGQLLDAFDKYYHEDVVMIEPRGNREGKVACRASEVQFLESVEAFHNLEVRSIGADDANNTTFVENMMDVTFKGGHRVQMEQVAVQKWQDGQIIHERFYYDNAS